MNENQSLATTENQNLANLGIATDSNTGALIPSNREQFEIIMELQKAEKEIEALGFKTTSPTDLAKEKVVFDIIDAWQTEIRDNDELKAVVCFQVEEIETGITHIVMQSANSIREKYAEFFGKWKAVNHPKILANYQFVFSDKYKKAGNSAIILERVQNLVKVVDVKAKAK